MDYYFNINIENKFLCFVVKTTADKIKVKNIIVKLIDIHRNVNNICNVKIESMVLIYKYEYI